MTAVQAGQELGTCGFNEHTARRLTAEAGFSSFRRVPMDNPFNNLYEAHAPGRNGS